MYVRHQAQLDVHVGGSQGLSAKEVVDWNGSAVCREGEFDLTFMNS